MVEPVRPTEGAVEGQAETAAPPQPRRLGATDCPRAGGRGGRLWGWGRDDPPVHLVPELRRVKGSLCKDWAGVDGSREPGRSFDR
eukprot:739702-Rhodomonas_salina.2